MSGEYLNIDPASIAQEAGVRVFEQRILTSRIPEDTRIIDNLFRAAEEFDLINQPYQVETLRCMALPADYHSDDRYLDTEAEISVCDLYNLAFKGRFIRYSKVAIKPKVGPALFQGLCLVFDRALLLPDRDPLSDEKALFVPAPSVQKIAPALDLH